jgi:hypothetical protein
MWGGIDVLDEIKRFSRTEDLLGLSTYINGRDLTDKSKDEDRPLDSNEKFISKNSKQWTNIDVWNETVKYFEVEVTHSVKYSGYLLNHTQKLAIDLDDYHRQSKYLSEEGNDVAIDAIPVLTETGDGAQMALYGGASADTTEKLVGAWCGDLLQIVDKLTEGYRLINCCFAERWSRAVYCYENFGASDDEYVLKDSDGTRFEVVKFGLIDFERGSPRYVKVEIQEEQNQIKYCTERKSKINL